MQSSEQPRKTESSALDNVPFENPTAARQYVDSLSGKLSVSLTQALPGLLADCPDPDSALLLLDQPSDEEFDYWAKDADAVVIGTASRSIDPSEAYRRTRDAVRLLQSAHPEVLAIKYCSTFDSTEAGNIGQSIDAAMDELGAEITVALPALPINQRSAHGSTGHAAGGGH